MVVAGLWGEQMNTTFVRARDPAPHVVEVGVVSGERARHRAGAAEQGHRRVGLERGVRQHDLVARFQRRRPDHRQELVGAVADDDLLGRHAQAPAEGLAQRGAAPVGIEVRAARLPRDGRHHARRGAQRALVGRQPHQLREPELRGQGLERLAGLVRGDAVENGSPASRARPRF